MDSTDRRLRSDEWPHSQQVGFRLPPSACRLFCYCGRTIRIPTGWLPPEGNGEFARGVSVPVVVFTENAAILLSSSQRFRSARACRRIPLRTPTPYGNLYSSQMQIRDWLSTAVAYSASFPCWSSRRTLRCGGTNRNVGRMNCSDSGKTFGQVIPSAQAPAG